MAAWNATEGDGISRAAVGLMADSHGEAHAIDRALDLFAAAGCARIYHLGDICDSARPESAAACLESLRRHGVIALRGNNDHAAARLLAERQGPDAIRSVAERLGRLPLAAQWRGALLVHSLPFVEELGAASMIGAMGIEEAMRVFERTPHSLVFRGHGHQPEMIAHRDGRAVVESLCAGDRIDLSVHAPCILTCGALSSGFCMLWHPEDRRVEVLTIGGQH